MKNSIWGRGGGVKGSGNLQRLKKISSTRPPGRSGVMAGDRVSLQAAKRIFGSKGAYRRKYMTPTDLSAVKQISRNTVGVMGTTKARIIGVQPKQLTEHQRYYQATKDVNTLSSLRTPYGYTKTIGPDRSAGSIANALTYLTPAEKVLQKDVLSGKQPLN